MIKLKKDRVIYLILLEVFPKKAMVILLLVAKQSSGGRVGAL